MRIAKRLLVFVGFSAAFLVLVRALWLLWDWLPRKPQRPGATDPFDIVVPYVLGLGFLFCGGLVILLVLLIVSLVRGKRSGRSAPVESESGP
jgi:hypothetical protein